MRAPRERGPSRPANLRWASDRAVLVGFEEFPAAEIPALVRAFLRAAGRTAFPGLVDLHPAYASVLVVFDPLAAAPESVVERLRALSSGLSVDDLPAARRVEIPVVYGGEPGPDLDDVARLSGLEPEEVIRCHASVDYTVAFLGFVPGFAYLDGLPEALNVPRLPAPRRRVPPGSLGVAHGQTAVYPLATPGGWRLIGRTPVELFHPDREPPALLSVGDVVSFAPIDAAEFARLAQASSR